MKTKISRRDLLKAGLAGALALSAGGIWYFNKPTLVNKLLEEFPEKIPGAGEIKKYEIKDASKCLVHVKQAHTNENITTKQREYVVNVQKEIYQILDYLHRNKRINEVYTEGLVEGCGRNPNPDLSFYNIKNGEITDAPELLELEGKIKLIPAERNEAHQEALNKNTTAEYIFNNRENVALDIISKSQNPLNVLVYGGAHWFGDNIHEWNSNHSDKKYSLIEITPESYGRRK